MILQAYKTMLSMFKKGLKRKKIKKYQLPLFMDRVSASLDYKGLIHGFSY